MDQERILKVTKAAEKFWLLSTVFATVVTIWFMYTDGVERNKFLPLIPILAGLWYVIRRIFRKRLERDLGK
ncbi:MAG: hypothetical protein VX548_00110 [Bacteroidota bacterium]|nr:hypothetical protein [Bacteroidota bacterium]